MPINIQGVNVCGGPWKHRSLHWQLLSRLTTLNLSEKVERFTNLNPFHGLLVYCCSLTYHRPKQSFCLSNSWLAIVQELRVTQERSSETIMTNPVIDGCLFFLFRTFLNLLSYPSFPLRLHSMLSEIRGTVLDL